MKKIIYGLLSLLVIVGVIVNISFFSSDKEKKKDSMPLYPGTIRIGYAPWPGYIAFFIAQEKGYFTEEGVSVELKAYPSLKELSEDYVSGKIHARANLNFDTVNETINGFEQNVVLVIDYSSGSDGIIARPGIDTFSNIIGKKVGYEFGTLEEFFLRNALTANGLLMTDIKSVDLNPEDAAKNLVAGNIDVAVTYEPSLSSALKDSKGNKIFTSANTPGLIVDLLTFPTNFVTQYPGSVDAITRAYFKGIAFLQKNPEEAYQILAKAYSTTPEDIKQQLDGIQVLTLEENEIAFTFAPGAQSLYVNLRNVYDFLREHKDVMNDLNTDTMINKKFIDKLSRISF